MTRNYSEQSLHITIASWLRGVRIIGNKEYPVPIPFPGLIWTHCANQGRSPREGHKLKRMGVRAGVSDFVFWWPSNAAAIELKSPTGTSSPAQKKFRAEFEAIGGKYAVCKTGEEVRDTLISWGLKCHNMAIDAPKPTRAQLQRMAHDMCMPMREKV
jgi:hypothetical protein